MKTTIISLLALICMLGCNGGKEKTDFEAKTEKKGPAAKVATGYAEVNGMRMYYEIHGKGEPIVLLHGAYMSMEGPMKKVAEKLSPNRKVILAELQGHGRTGDIGRAITYESLGDDIAALMRHLKIDSADVMGYSMGAGAALQLAVRHPGLVKKAVLISGSYSDKGVQPSLKPMIPQMSADMFAGSPMKTEYNQLSPDSTKFPVLVEKLKALDMKEYDWEKDYVKIRKPLFLIFGDSDVVVMDHINDMFTKLGGNVMGDLTPMPNVRLAVLPYTSHINAINRVDWFAPMVDEFLGIEK
ncbi:alpha/beta fold hydrolase [Dyadobacter aurulentus]|uniref:alpha/beta fold hydrolase n=1 Tax=Dyadobacter sp. UC 10 TaxID=2605428 RepID=UPI0011F1ABEB|nr:alpha/beta hydrolase [Dyadobacter sp. UC 10]KAA0992821.1 alpha/beta hydrolase [Dyadobacter sp. UC 10]